MEESQMTDKFLACTVAELRRQSLMKRIQQGKSQCPPHRHREFKMTMGNKLGTQQRFRMEIHVESEVTR